LAERDDRVVRDRIIDQWIKSTKETKDTGAKRVYYLSLEFLIGRLTRDAFSNVGMLDDMRAALASLDVDLDLIAALEPDAALGNGGLGRLAACFMESMATVDVPAHGYGIRYVNGMFRQEISDGKQVELPETWLDHGNPWEFERRERSFEIGFGGTVEGTDDADGAESARWIPDEHVLAVAYDTPIVGWRTKRVNTLRLWSAMPVDPILLRAVQCRRSRRRAGGKQQGRRAVTCALSARLAQSRAGIAAAAGIFLLLGLAARHYPAASEHARRTAFAARQGRDPAQRYAPGGRGCRNDRLLTDIHGFKR
jgi:glycogen/starch/alpha-glucan phosphorylase-like protein